MKFKDFLKEKYINTNKEYFFLLDGRVPLAPKLWSRINKIEKIPLCYHTTDLKGLNVVKKLQGKQKQISTFTNGDATVSMGVETAGGVLIELSGESTLSLDGDAWTSLDRSGTRWWDLREMVNGQGHLAHLTKLRETLIEAMKDLLEDEFHKLLTKDDIQYSTPAILASRINEKFSGKDKAKFIKRGLETAEKHIKHIDFKEIIASANTEGKKIYGNMAYFNEIVLHNFKIKNVYGVATTHHTSSEQKMMDDHNSGKLKLDGWVWATYIEDIAGGKVESVKTFEDLS